MLWNVRSRVERGSEGGACGCFARDGMLWIGIMCDVCKAGIFGLMSLVEFQPLHRCLLFRCEVG
jgi:hypothetical protein